MSFALRFGLWAGLSLVLPAFSFAESVPTVQPFPKTGLLPKEEIGALRLRKKHPEYDGRNVVVAIFDTGVDPGAAGLQTTPSGQPKIVDMIDATGSGDVLMSELHKPKGKTLIGLTGRTLKLNTKWKNPTGEYRLGIKSAFELYPGALVARRKRQRRTTFLKQHRVIESRLRGQIRSYKTKHPKPNAAQKRKLSELQDRMKQLNSFANHPDPGPVFDCVVFHDGEHFRAVIDTDEDGDLADEKAMTNYRVAREHTSFGNATSLNFSVNIYEKGKRLSIVVASGAHGTHVAGIVGAHYPKQPELDGIAPGTQIVSVKIGDTRLGSMETGAALIRGLRAVVDTKCDLINMSYGESSTIPDRGRIISLCNEIVRKHGVIFVASAGNEGPALSTAGTPGGTTSDVIGVGAYVSPQMMAVEYTLRKALPGLPYTWTSRGPTFDGDMGVDIFAPGGAIAPVPTWTLQKSMRMNGTSMASPNTCGAVALLLSGLKATKTRFTPYSIRRAMKNTAKRIETVDVFAQGPGLLQVDQALDHLLKHATNLGEQLRFEVKVGRQSERGIYLRDPHELNHPNKSTVSVRPVFPAKVSPQEKINFELRINLQATESWVEVGQHAVLTHGGMQFEINVDQTKLPPGAHFAEVCGYDATNPSRGPLFRVPITVLRPTECKADGGAFQETIKFEPGTTARRFFVTPDGATRADLTLHAKTSDRENRRFVLHAMRIHHGESIDATAKRTYITLRDGQPYETSFSVTGGHLQEVCLAQYWSSLDPSEVEMRLTFHGISPSKKQINLSPGQPQQRVEVTSPFRKETITPAAKLTTHRAYHRPATAVIATLDPTRDRLPNGRRIYGLTLTYEFDQKSPGSVTPRFPRLDGLLYDAPVGPHLWMLFDPAKRLVTTDDIWPSARRIGKGKHTLKLQIRHSDVTQLEQWKTLPLVIDRPLSRSISLSISRTRVDAVSKQGRFSSRIIGPGDRTDFVISAPMLTQIPAAFADGDQLLGTVTYIKPNAVNNEHHESDIFQVVYSGAATGRNRSSKLKSAQKIPVTGDWKGRLQKLKIAELQHLVAGGKLSPRFETLFTELKTEKPQELKILTARLRLLDHEKFRKERLSEIVKAADAVLAEINTAELATHFGTNIDPDNEKAVARRKIMTARRSTLTDTLYRKGRALGYMELPEVLAKYPIGNKKKHNADFEANFAELRKWADTTDHTFFLLHVRWERRRGNLAAALKVLGRHASDNEPNYWHTKKRRDMFEQLGWKHLWNYEARKLILAFPKQHAPF